MNFARQADISAVISVMRCTLLINSYLAAAAILFIAFLLLIFYVVSCSVVSHFGVSLVQLVHFFPFVLHLFSLLLL